MQVIQIKTSTLIPYAMNAKKHSEHQVTQIAASIKEFGFCNPVLIDKDNGIIAGHGRIMAAKKLGMESVPCIILEHLTDAQRKAYIIADNRLAETGGGWDEEILKAELEALQEIDFNVDFLELDDVGSDQDLSIGDAKIPNGDDGDLIVCPKCGLKFCK